MSYSTYDTIRQKRILRYMKTLRQNNSSDIALFYRNTIDIDEIDKSDLRIFENLYMDNNSHSIYQTFSKYEINNFLDILKYRELINKQSILRTDLKNLKHIENNTRDTLDEYDQLIIVENINILPKELNNIVMEFL